MSLQSKVIAETITVKFDFTAYPSAFDLTDPVVTVVVLSGVDPDPEDILEGTATFDGRVVDQQIARGLGGVIYGLICTAEVDATYETQQQLTLAILTDTGTFQPGADLLISGTIDPFACESELFYYALPITGGTPAYGPVSISSGSMPTGWSVSVVGTNVIVSGTALAGSAGVYSFTILLTDFAGNIATSLQTVTVEDCGGAGDLYVWSGTAISCPSYWKIDMGTDTIGVIGADSSFIGFLWPSNDDTRLYCINAAKEFGYYLLADDTFYPINTDTIYGVFVLDSTETYVYILDQFGFGNNMYKIRIADGAVLDTEAMPSVPSAILITADNAYVYVVTYSTGNYYKYNTTTGNAVAVSTGTRNGNRAMVLNAAETRLYTAGIDSGTSAPWITVYNTSSGAKTAEGTLAEYASDIKIHPNGLSLAVPNFEDFSGLVLIYEVSSLTLTASIVVGVKPNKVFYKPDGTRLYVSNGTSNNVMVIDVEVGSPDENTVIGTLSTNAEPYIQWKP